jgi:subtilase family serine protease
MSELRLVPSARARKPRGRFVQAIEAMEPRVLLSGGASALKKLAHPAAHVAAVHQAKAHHPKVVHSKVVHPKPAAHHKLKKKAAVPVAIVNAGPLAAPSATPSSVPAPGLAPFTPAEIRHFYGLDTLSLGGIVGDGRGQTIAIIDAYSAPKLLNTTNLNFATSANDLYTFDQQFGLPNPPSFKKINQAGGTSLPTAYDSNWAIESSLDVEWAHVMAPAANIVLIEANSPSNGDLMTAAVSTARNYPGVVAVSMSWGESEFFGETSNDSLFTTPAGHPGVTFLAAVGDAGAAATNYPAFSPNVVAVGGSQITTANANSDYGSETTWNDSYGATGGAISIMEAKPDYQSAVTQSATMRTVPDVSFDAAVTTGVYVLDTSQPGVGGFDRRRRSRPDAIGPGFTRWPLANPAAHLPIGLQRFPRCSGRAERL